MRARTARPLVPGPSLAAVLGGDWILPGHEREAVLVWQSLRARASDGDVAAGELAAVLDDDSERVLRALGRDRASVPLVGRAAPAAILLRAHALERLGHHDEALRALRAYPLHRVFTKVAGQFATLRLAERASAAHAAEQARASVLEVARLAGPTPAMWMSGAALLLSGGVFFVIGAYVAGAVGWSNADAWTNGIIGALCAVPGLAMLAVAARKAIHVARIRRANRIPAAPERDREL